MSTKFTNSRNVTTNPPPLGLDLINANQWMSSSLLHLMHQRGHSDLSSPHLLFFCNLDCGMTHASAVARRMGITRQAVYKITKELQRIEVLTLTEDPADRRQKVITMTGRGEQIALDGRACMAEIERHLADQIGRKNLNQLIGILRMDWGPMLGAPDSME